MSARQLTPFLLLPGLFLRTAPFTTLGGADMPSAIPHCVPFPCVDPPFCRARVRFPARDLPPGTGVSLLYQVIPARVGA